MESSSSSSSSLTDRFTFRTQVLAGHLRQTDLSAPPSLGNSVCLSYSPPDLTEPFDFDTKAMRKLLDGHNFVDRDWLFGLMVQSKLFCPRNRGGKVFVGPDYNQSMEQQREMTMKRIEYLSQRGVFDGWLTKKGPEAELRKFAFLEIMGIYDHSLAIKIGVHFFLWGGAIQFFGTKRHHEKWLRDTETYAIKGCFAMTELGHGSNVCNRSSSREDTVLGHKLVTSLCVIISLEDKRRSPFPRINAINVSPICVPKLCLLRIIDVRGIETVTTYDSNTGEFVISTPCESAQKYWIGGAANHATHTIVFSQLNINGNNQGVHAFIAQIRDANGNICPNVRITDCGHKIGLNGVDNGRIWFDNVRIPRENLLNSVANVSPDGQYLSAIKDPDQRFAAFLAPLTSGRVTIAVSATYSAKIGLATAIRYSLSRRAFSLTPNGPEVLILDYPSHQRHLLPLLAKTYAMSFAANYLKMLYLKRTPELNKTIHIVSSAFKATLTWHNMRTLQECREACGGQGLKTENLVGHLKSEFDVQSTFEGDNNVLMQQVSKALLAEFVTTKKRKTPFKALGLEHMNNSSPVIPSQLTSSNMRSTQFQTDIFCLRERDLLNRFASQVSQRQVLGESKEFTFTVTYQLAEDLGRAFSDRAILQTFIDAEASVSAGPLKNILGLLRSMYALVTLEEDAAFLRYGYLSTDNAAAVRDEVAKLCGELRPHALALVSSFGIPDAFLGPIAFNWVEANSWSSVQH